MQTKLLSLFVGKSKRTTIFLYLVTYSGKQLPLIFTVVLVMVTQKWKEICRGGGSGVESNSGLDQAINIKASKRLVGAKIIVTKKF